jgi:hypothetical protein
MKNIEIVVSETTGEEYVVIDRENGEFTSMLKSTYDAQQAAINDLS